MAARHGAEQLGDERGGDGDHFYERGRGALGTRVGAFPGRGDVRSVWPHHRGAQHRDRRDGAGRAVRQRFPPPAAAAARGKRGRVAPSLRVPPRQRVGKRGHRGDVHGAVRRHHATDDPDHARGVRGRCDACRRHPRARGTDAEVPAQHGNRRRQPAAHVDGMPQPATRPRGDLDGRRRVPSVRRRAGRCVLFGVLWCTPFVWPLLCD